MRKIGIIGDYESVCGFLATGFDTAVVSTRDEAKEKLQEMVRQNYSIIYITSEFFFEINSDTIAVIPLPDKNSSVGVNRIEDFTEKAAGSKI